MKDEGEVLTVTDYQALWKDPRRKYGAVPTEVDGVTFHSKAEAGRYKQLRLLLAAGKIADLTLQPAYPLVVDNVYITTYRADFRYWDRDDACWKVEDVKGVANLLYKVKRNLLLALYGIAVIEIPADSC